MKTKYLSIIFISRIPIVLAWLFFGLTPAFGQNAVPVVVMETKRDVFVDRVEALGTLRANETIELTSTVSEIVTFIAFDDGQRVEAGDILVEMTSREEHALIEEEKSTIAEAKKQYDRVKRLADQGAISKSLYDQRRREYEAARARLRALESKLHDRLIVAPFSGIVGLRNISVGALVEPGDLVTTLDDDSIMKLEFTVPAVYLATLKKGLPIAAKSPAFPDRRFNGKVTSIDSRIDPSTRSVVVRATIPNKGRLLKPGLLMSVELQKNPREILVVPEEALIPLGREHYVFVVDRSTEPFVATRRKVSIGGRRIGEVEILSGLDSGELVITHGSLRVQQGQPVKIIAVDSGDESLSSLLRQNSEGSDQ
jgi:membrane fusion protein (multidrug efflux system)